MPTVRYIEHEHHEDTHAVEMPIRLAAALEEALRHVASWIFGSDTPRGTTSCAIADDVAAACVGYRRSQNCGEPGDLYGIPWPRTL